MSKKIYATEVDGEHYDYRMYYDEDMAVEDGIWAGGNRDFGDTNKDLREDVVKSLEDAYYDLYEVDDVTEEDRISTLNYYFKKNSKEALTDYECDLLSNLTRMFSHCSSRDENDIICQVLTVITGKNYECGVIKGCCQGDWLEIIYPEERKAMIPWIEAVWFATGTEFAITCEEVEANEVDDAECYYDYTDLYRSDDIKNWIAENAHVSPENVVIRKIANRHIHYTYDYAEE